MVVKAALAVVVLAMEPNSTAQLLPTVLIEGLYAVIFAFATPFTIGLLNTLTLVTQFFVVLALSLNTLHRVQPDDLGPTYGLILVAVGGVTAIAQVGCLMWPV